MKNADYWNVTITPDDIANEIRRQIDGHGQLEIAIFALDSLRRFKVVADSPRLVAVIEALEAVNPS